VNGLELQESRLVRQLKASIAAEAQARSLADSACTLLQQQAADLADATAQREVRVGPTCTRMPFMGAFTGVKLWRGRQPAVAAQQARQSSFVRPQLRREGLQAMLLARPSRHAAGADIQQLLQAATASAGRAARRAARLQGLLGMVRTQVWRCGLHNQYTTVVRRRGRLPACWSNWLVEQ
jgi:hypothetical protein